MNITFGTDGLRGEVNVDLTPEIALELGRATILLVDSGSKVVIGRDTRLSGEMLESSLASGMVSQGINVFKLGVIPTPAVPLLIKELNASLGVVISASHNLASDNGIKFFTKEGFKLGPETEKKLERVINEGGVRHRAKWKKIGKIVDMEDALQKYEYFLKNEVLDEELNLSDMHVVLDCAHGATYQVAPKVLRELGPEVTLIHAEPNGCNINLDCGSTCLNDIQKKVVDKGAHLGIAYDGDGDRALFIDETGQIVNGDTVMYIFSRWLKQREKLNPPILISTVMSNLGLEKSLENLGIQLIRTPVGDRYVAEEIEKNNALLGGEQCGHIIFRDCNTTGDGIVTTLKVLKILGESGKPLSSLASEMDKYPQVLKNVEIGKTEEFFLDGKIGEEVNKWEKTLGMRGRILVRPSGTQPVVRVMVEAVDQELADKAATGLCKVIEQELNG